MSFCTSCGQPISGNPKFCTKCGSTLTQAASPHLAPPPPVMPMPASSQKRNMTPLIITIALVVVLAGASVWYFFFRTPNNNNSSTTRSSINTNSGDSVSMITPGKYPEGSERLITNNDVSRLGNNDVKIMRNEIYARHGYIFTSNDLRDYFTQQPWYRPQYSDVASMLSDLEKSNIAFLKTYEQNQTSIPVNQGTTTSNELRLSEYSSETISSEKISAISRKVDAFMDAGNREDIDAILSFFSYPVERYYDVNNCDYDLMKRRYDRYYHQVDR